MNPNFSPFRIAVFATILCVIAGCASGPDIDLDRYDHQVTPDNVVADPDVYHDRQVLWGGLVIGISHADNMPELEILAYPLMRGARPDMLLAPTGRFIARSGGDPDSLEVVPGNRVTVAGSVVEVIRGQLGGVETRFPLVRADQLYPWSAHNPWQDPRVGFGFGFFYVD